MVSVSTIHILKGCAYIVSEKRFPFFREEMHFVSSSQFCISMNRRAKCHSKSVPVLGLPAAGFTERFREQQSHFLVSNVINRHPHLMLAQRSQMT